MNPPTSSSEITSPSRIIVLGPEEVDDGAGSSEGRERHETSDMNNTKFVIFINVFLILIENAENPRKIREEPQETVGKRDQKTGKDQPLGFEISWSILVGFLPFNSSHKGIKYH